MANSIKPCVLLELYTPVDLEVKINSTQQDIMDVGADTSYVHIYMTNLIKTL